ncbi:hypothetical protein L208DRAFT_1546537, partial [Tricholoma matsutake]
GRKRKVRDLHAILEVCTCGEAVTDEEISTGKGIIRCESAGCETRWYHLQCVELEYHISSWACEACEASGSNQRHQGRQRQHYGKI